MAKANSPDEASPWAIIMVNAACHPHNVLVIIAAKRGPIWVTELYAINAFRSAWRRQISPEIKLPHKARAIRGRDKILLACWKIGVNRNSPNPPSFKRIPANTMEPAIGASTCALGSHRCKE